MTTEATPGNVPLSAQLGPADEAQPLVERLRTDVLWHQKRGNETIARDCQEAADEIERLRGALLLMRGRLMMANPHAVTTEADALLLGPNVEASRPAGSG